MGLDNIPHRYPCRLEGTAVEQVGSDGHRRIDCDQTQAAGGCPWMRDHPRDAEPVVGSFLGTDCWYRGKVGTYMLERLDAAGHPLPSELQGGFYGPGDIEAAGGQPDLPPEHCRGLADWMADRGEAYLAEVRADVARPDASLPPGMTPEQHVAEAASDYRYTVWWLRWAADNAQGADAWW